MYIPADREGFEGETERDVRVTTGPTQPNCRTLVQRITVSNITQRHRGFKSQGHNQMKALLLLFHVVMALASETSVPLSSVVNRDPLYQSTTI